MSETAVKEATLAHEMPVMVSGPSTSRIIAIDPGSSSGAIATWTWDAMKQESCVSVCNMPETPGGIFGWFKNTLNDNLPGMQLTRIVCENVGAGRPGNAAKAMYTFAVHRGHLEMTFLALGYPCRWVLPRMWMKQLFKDGYPTGNENKNLRKQFIHLEMVKRHPGLKFTKRQADALALLTWALERRFDKDGNPEI